MRFLVLGASGMAGHVICLYLTEQGHEVVGYSRRKIPFFPCIAGDVNDLQKLTQIVREGSFTAVINAVGVLNQFAEKDKEQAVFLNGYLPHFLAKITRDLQTQIIHMSTDCVFAGNSGPYTEEAVYDGQTFYDRTKALGELKDKKNITFRNSIVGPDINKNGIGLLNWFMQQEGEIQGYTHAMWTGITTLELAKAMESAAKVRETGLINLVYKESISKYELLKLFNHYLRRNKIVILPYDDYVMDKTLIRTNFEFNYDVPDYETMISEMAIWMKRHKELYKHYKPVII